MNCYYDYSITGNNINDWKKIHNKCKNEIMNTNSKIWIDWPEKNLYGKNMEWKIVPICYCVPSDNVNNKIWIDSVRKFIPNIYNFIKSQKNIRTALISRMCKNVKLKYHQGWACVSNHILRCHLPLLVEDEKSGVIVNRYTEFHKEGDYILFDDSMSHCGFNNSNNCRYVLIIDYVRPIDVKPGISEITVSDELTKLCSFYTEINKLYSSLEK